MLGKYTCTHKSQVPLNAISVRLTRGINVEHIIEMSLHANHRDVSEYSTTFWNTLWVVTLEQTTPNNECKFKNQILSCTA